MSHRGLALEIPGWGSLHLGQALFDLNGTLAVDGVLSAAVREGLRELQNIFGLYVITADTHGTASEVLQDCGDVEIVRIQPGDEGRQKCAFLEKLGAASTVAVGNGANDARMLRRAGLGVCVLASEGAAIQALLASDLVVGSAEEALELLLRPARLLATLRS